MPRCSSLEANIGRSDSVLEIHCPVAWSNRDWRRASGGPLKWFGSRTTTVTTFNERPPVGVYAVMYVSTRYRRLSGPVMPLWIGLQGSGQAVAVHVPLTSVALYAESPW